MNYNYNQDYIGIVAPKGSGKTYFTKSLIEQIPQVFVIDTNGEYSNSLQNIQTIVPEEYSPVEFDKILNDVIKKYRNLTIVIDDIDVYTPLKSAILPMFNSNSRHNGLGLIFISRRPKKLDPVMILNCDYLILGYPLLPQDKKYLEETLNFKIEDKLINSLKQYQFILLDVKNRTQEIIYV